MAFVVFFLIVVAVILFMPIGSVLCIAGVLGVIIFTIWAVVDLKKEDSDGYIWVFLAIICVVMIIFGAAFSTFADFLWWLF